VVVAGISAFELHSCCYNIRTQIGASSHISTLSMKDSIVISSPSCTSAVYKGLTVSVYNVDKTEINLTRQDLVELVNVCSISSIYLSNLSSYLYVHSHLAL